MYLRREKPIDDAFFAGLAEAKKVIDAFEKDLIEKNKGKNPSWEMLAIHAVMARKHADMLAAYLAPDATEETREAAKEDLQALFYSFEEKIGEAFDPVLYNRLFGRTLKKFHDAPTVILT